MEDLCDKSLPTNNLFTIVCCMVMRDTLLVKQLSLTASSLHQKVPKQYVKMEVL